MLQVKVQQRPDDVVYQVVARSNDAGPSEDAAVLRDYFNLQACLAELCQEWSSRDARFKSIHKYFPGSGACQLSYPHLQSSLHAIPEACKVYVAKIRLHTLALSNTLVQCVINI